ncbi:MAG: Rrf2 family transcriptional regulator [Acidobacteriota bacterium]
MNSDLTLALHVMGFLTACRGQAVTSERLAGTYGTNAVVVRRVISRLNKAGLVKTRRGSGGGSVLARSADSINLRQIFEAVAASESPELLRRHPGKESPVAEVLAGFINEFYSDAEEALLKRFESVTIEEMDGVVRPRIVALLHDL